MRNFVNCNDIIINQLKKKKRFHRQFQVGSHGILHFNQKNNES